MAEHLAPLMTPVETQKGIQPIQVSFEGKEPRHEEACKEFLAQHPNSLPSIYISKDNAQKYI